MRRRIQPGLLAGCVLALALMAFGPASTQTQSFRVGGPSTAKALELRAGPGPGYPVVGLAPPLTPINVDACQPIPSFAYSWCRIRYGRTVGWLSAKYVVDQSTGLSPDGRAPAVRATPTPVVRAAPTPTVPMPEPDIVAPAPIVRAPPRTVPMPEPDIVKPLPVRKVRTALYRVTKVKSWDTLNIRSGPDHRTAVIGTIPANGRGIRRLDCASNGKWCRIDYQGSKGWVSNHFLTRM